MNEESAIRVEGLGKRYSLRSSGDRRPDTALGSLASGARRLATGGRRQAREDFWALRDVDFELAQGEVLGVMGSNGAGKSTLLKILSAISEPTEGRVEVRGRLGSLLEVGTGFHPELSGRDNVFLNGAVLGMPRAQVAAQFDDIVEFSGVSRFIDTPVKFYSSGMYVRLAFAVAAHLEPDVLLVDEVLSVGDQAFQEKCLGRIRDVTSAGRTVIFVSHNMPSVTSLCTKGMVLEAGRIAFQGTVHDAARHYLSKHRRLAGEGDLSDVLREGSGEIAFASVSIRSESEDALVYPDRALSISVTLRSDQPIAGRHLSLGFGINTMLGERLCTLLTKFDPEQELRTVDVQSGTEVTCHIPELPLRPGRYLLSLYLDRSGELLDRIQNQVELVIEPSDYFGTGSVPSDSQGPLMVRQRWRVDGPRTPVSSVDTPLSSPQQPA